jgi:hypothetical protein
MRWMGAGLGLGLGLRTRGAGASGWLLGWLGCGVNRSGTECLFERELMQEEG